MWEMKVSKGTVGDGGGCYLRQTSQRCLWEGGI